MTAVKDWISLVTNIGLLVGIILVIYELRQNSIQMESSAYQDRTADLIALDAMIMESDHLGSALSKIGGGCEQEPLTAIERITYRAWLTSHAHRVNNLLHQYSLGVLDESYMRSIQQPMADFNHTWTHQGIWQGVRVVDEYENLGFAVPEAKACSALSDGGAEDT